jgi:peptidyl-prolyl cis-trans isomerase D
LRVGKHILEVLKADQNIGQNPMFMNSWCFDIAKFKEYFKSNPEQAQFLKTEKRCRVECKISNIYIN